MTSDQYIQNNKTNTLKKGDNVRMVDCGEASLYSREFWVCQTDSFNQCGSELVFLEGFSGSFLTKYLEKV